MARGKYCSLDDSMRLADDLISRPRPNERLIKIKSEALIRRQECKQVQSMNKERGENMNVTGFSSHNTKLLYRFERFL
jgi:hypothetical protein